MSCKEIILLCCLSGENKAKALGFNCFYRLVPQPNKYLKFMNFREDVLGSLFVTISFTLQKINEDNFNH